MSALKVLVAAMLAFLALMVLSSVTDSAKRHAAYPARFPAGSGRAIAERACLTCHAAPLVAQQHKDSTGWEKTLRQMETWGVRLSPAERDTLFTYLRSKFGAARKPR